MTRKAIGDIAPARLPPDLLARNFGEVEPPLDRQAALVEASRCFYCFDAPCIQACPTGIEIPRFIKRIATEDQRGAADAILTANILGGMCARVCPTEILCEGDCVRNTEGDTAIRIGALQRYATDWVYRDGTQLFARAAQTGRRIAVLGAGPAGLSCAHALALRGHQVDMFDALGKPGGLNEYGIAAYKVPGFAQREIDWLLGIGGIAIHTDRTLGRDLHLDDLRQDYDALFIGVGLSGVNQLGIADDAVAGVRDAVDFIAELRQCPDLSTLPVGRRVLVIGGGNTAIDAAVQSKRLGAEQVTLIYRRGPESMSATPVEQAFAKEEGVNVIHWARPSRVLSEAGQLTGMEFEYTEMTSDGRLTGVGEHFTLPADSVLKAIGQTLSVDGLSSAGNTLMLRGGRIAVDGDYRTDVAGVWAGGDCAAQADAKPELTVQAVEDGKRAAASIHRALVGQEN
jgi:glutamate synthase (NADPH/NADH) small chain